MRDGLGGVRGISWQLRGHINKNTRKTQVLGTGEATEIGVQWLG